MATGRYVGHAHAAVAMGRCDAERIVVATRASATRTTCRPRWHACVETAADGASADTRARSASRAGERDEGAIAARGATTSEAVRRPVVGRAVAVVVLAVATFGRTRMDLRIVVVAIDAARAGSAGTVAVDVDATRAGGNAHRTVAVEASRARSTRSARRDATRLGGADRQTPLARAAVGISRAHSAGHRSRVGLHVARVDPVRIRRDGRVGIGIDVDRDARAIVAAGEPPVLAELAHRARGTHRSAGAAHGGREAIEREEDA